MAFLGMNRILISLCLIFISVELSAQQHSSFIGINAGTAFPVGKFNKTDLSEGGFTQPGLNVSFEGAWFFKPWLGVGGNAGIDLFPVDVASLGAEKAKSDPYITGAIVRSDPYFTASFYAGAYFKIPLKGQLSFTAKALGGLIFAQTPYQLYKIDYYLIGRTYAEVTPAYDYAGSFQAGAGLRYDFNDYLGVAINSEFSYNTCEFEFYKPDGSARIDKKVITYVNLAAGLVIKL
jgi:hypothetical protein